MVTSKNSNSNLEENNNNAECSTDPKIDTKKYRKSSSAQLISTTLGKTGSSSRRHSLDGNAKIKPVSESKGQSSGRKDIKGTHKMTVVAKTQVSSNRRQSSSSSVRPGKHMGDKPVAPGEVTLDMDVSTVGNEPESTDGSSVTSSNTLKEMKNKYQATSPRRRNLNIKSESENRAITTPKSKEINPIGDKWKKTRSASDPSITLPFKNCAEKADVTPKPKTDTDSKKTLATVSPIVKRRHSLAIATGAKVLLAASKWRGLKSKIKTQKQELAEVKEEKQEKPVLSILNDGFSSDFKNALLSIRQ